MRAVEPEQLVAGRFAGFRSTLSELNEVLEGMFAGALTTIGNDGVFQQRRVALAAPVRDENIWLVTHRREERTCPMNGTRDVFLSFEEPRSGRMLTLTVRPEVVQDRRRLRSLWDERMEREFPAGLEDPFVTLLLAHVESIDAWNEPFHRVIHFDAAPADFQFDWKTTCRI